MLNALLAAAALASAFGQSQRFVPSPLLRFDASPQDIEGDCGRALARAQSALSTVVHIDDAGRTFDNTPAALDQALGTLGDETASETFLKDVSVSSSTRQAAVECQTKLDQFNVDVFTREDLFKALNAYAAKKESLTGESKRLLEKELEDFRRNGLLLPPAKRDAAKKLRQRLVELEERFEKNISEVKDGLWLTRAQLDGLPDDYVARLKRNENRYFVSVDYPDYFPFMENAKDADARRRLEALFDNRAFKENEPLLKEMLALRRDAARLLGYGNHAAYMLEPRMAKNPAAVERFIHRLVLRLKPLGKDERAELLAMKKAGEGPGFDGQLHIWDWRYYHNQLRKQRYDIDEEKIKDYFPLETVVSGMLGVYQELLGLKFRKIDGGFSWHPDVVLYEISDAGDGRIIGYFYMDLFPRDGKYKHAAAFSIIQGRLLPDGTYQKPVSAIVANFNKPSPGKPSLLKHGEHEEVETLFHEFGHIMHQTLTRARFARFSGSNVALDFVEAPSQMFENWVWDPRIISRMSGHYADPSKKLPAETLAKMVEAKNLDAGLINLRQMLFAAVDMDYHTRSRVDDPTAIWDELARRISLIPIQAGTHPEASFGHLVGYDAGYYGYMWSKVFAQDMFSRFEAEGLLNPAIGRRFREAVLEKGGGEDEGRLIEDFLGRKPNEDAFLRSIGLTIKP